MNCSDLVKTFQTEKGQSHPELDDENCVVKCLSMFFTDITENLNKLNAKLQGAGQTVLEPCNKWEALVQKLAFFSSDDEISTFCLRELSAQRSICTTEIHGYIRRLQTEFTTRFQDFLMYGPLFSFLIKPESLNDQLDFSLFNCLDTEDMEMQLIELMSSTLWETKFAEL